MKFGDCLQKSIQNTFIKNFYITDYIFIPNRFQKVKVYYINNILYLKKMKLIQQPYHLKCAINNEIEFY